MKSHISSNKGFWYWMRSFIAFLVNLILFFSFTFISMLLNGFLFFWLGKYVVFPIDINLSTLSDIIKLIKFDEVNLGTIVIVSLGLMLDIAKSVTPIMRNYLLSKGDALGAIRAEGFGGKLTLLSILATTITFALVSENIAKSSSDSELQVVIKQIARKDEKINGSLQDELNLWKRKDEEAEKKGEARYTTKITNAKKAIDDAKDELSILENEKIMLEKNALTVSTDNKEKKNTISKYLSNMFAGILIGFVIARLLEAGVRHTAHALTVNNNEFVTLDETIKEYERQKKVSWFVALKNWKTNFFMHGLILEGEVSHVKIDAPKHAQNDTTLLAQNAVSETVSQISSQRHEHGSGSVQNTVEDTTISECKTVRVNTPKCAKAHSKKRIYNKQKSLSKYKPNKEEIMESLRNGEYEEETVRGVMNETGSSKNIVTSAFKELVRNGEMWQENAGNKRYYWIDGDDFELEKQEKNNVVQLSFGAES